MAEESDAKQEALAFNLGENNDNDKYIFLDDNDVLEFNKFQSICEEVSLLSSYVMVLVTICLGITCAVLGIKHENFQWALMGGIIALFVSIGLIYLYNKYLPKLREKNLCCQQIVINGVDDAFSIINSEETIICKCFHLERYGQKIFECGLTEIQNVECTLNEQNEMLFTIYWFDKKSKSNEVKVFGHEYFFCNQEWVRRIKYALNNAKQWNI